MDRRNFVAKGFVGASGLAAAGPPGFLSAAERGGSALYALDDYVARMDAGLARIGEWSIKSMIPAFEGDPAELDDLGRDALKSLYMTAMFSDLPVESQAQPDVQERMWAIQATMDRAVTGMSAFLERQTADTFARIRSALEADPTAVRGVMDFVDSEAARGGISTERRRQTRAMFEQARWRMGHQPPSLLVNEYLEKVERIDASDIESAAREAWIASKVGEKVFWAQEQERSRRQRRITRGLRTMGIGALVFVGGVILVAATDSALTGVGLLGGTVGSIMFVIGLIILLVGLGTPEGAV